MNDSTMLNERIRSFIIQKFPLARKRGLHETDNLMENGVVDSLGVLELVGFMEREFSLSVSDEELTMDNFQSVQHIAAFIEAKARARQGSEGNGC